MWQVIKVILSILGCAFLGLMFVFFVCAGIIYQELKYEESEKKENE